MKHEDYRTVGNSIFIQIMNSSIYFVSLPVDSVVLFAGYSFQISELEKSVMEVVKV